MRLRRVTEILANIVVIVSGVALTYALITRYWNPNGQTPSPPILAIKSGESVPELQGIKWSDSPQTLVMAMAPGCEFCKMSMPLYNRLADASKGREIPWVGDRVPRSLHFYEQKSVNSFGPFWT